MHNFVSYLAASFLCLLASEIQSFQHLHLDLISSFPKLSSKTESFRSHLIIPKSRPSFVLEFRKPKLSRVHLVSQDDSSFTRGCLLPIHFHSIVHFRNHILVFRRIDLFQFVSGGSEFFLADLGYENELES
jgi:hypothetical protein